MNKFRKGWEVKTVGELFDIQLGKMLNKTATELSPQFSYLGNSNVRWGSFELDNLKTMHFTEKEISKFELKFGDILMCEGGEVGRCAIWRDELDNVYYQKALHRLRSKGKIIPEYFYNYMMYISGTKLLEDQTSKTSIAHLTREKLIALKINLPPLPEQIKIAEILSTWDNAIQTTEKQLANSQQQKKALMQMLLSGEKRVAGFSGEWNTAKLVKLATISKGTQRNKDTLSETGLYPVINGGIEPSGYTDQFNSSRNTITISEGGNSCGYVAFQKQDFWCGGHCYALENVQIDNLFLYQLLKANEESIMRLRVGSGLPNIQKKALEGFSLHYPKDMIEQQKIAEILTTADQEIETLQRKLECLKLEKRALMQKLL